MKLSLVLFFSYLTISNAYSFIRTETITVDKGHKEIRVRSPRKIAPNTKLPLILNLHGYTGGSFRQHLVIPFKVFIKSKNFILVNPEGIKDDEGNTYWTAENCCGEVADKTKRRDDVKFLNNIIDKVISMYPVDQNKIFIAGHSNGGFMANKLACEADSRIAGIINHSGAAFSKPESCQVPRPIKVLHIHGTNDETIDYNGASWHPGAQASVNQWLERNNCSEAKVTQKINVSPLSGRKITEEAWNDCDGNSKVSFWTIKDGHHRELFSWPMTKKILEFIFD